ncbi:GNAT family N-acetyltransferase [Cellulosimicrobium sp. PMB13]|uniref:GNAT family N-acetyltransferase n=1 Tax=Cellulosimicrobium sp. PMB13 TaxID=3120158 RepID=UPI003F4B4C79
MPTDGRTVRRARPVDAPALVRLRVELMRAMGESDADGQVWQDRALAWFRDALAADDAAAFVVDEDGAVVAGALVTLGRGAPSARNPRGLTAHLSNVCTLPSARGRGYGRACVEAAIGWARDAGVDSVALHATPDGEELYRSLGFVDTTYTELRLRW